MRRKKNYRRPDPSPIEIAFWQKAKPLIPELEKEIHVGKYRVDFLIPSKKIIVELYGYEYHNSRDQFTKDRERERYLQNAGFKIYSFTGREIYQDVDKCVNEVLAFAGIDPMLQFNFRDLPKYEEKEIPTPRAPTPEIKITEVQTTKQPKAENRREEVKQSPTIKPIKKSRRMKDWQIVIILIMATIATLVSLFAFSVVLMG